MRRKNFIVCIGLVFAASLFAETRYFVSSPRIKDFSPAFAFVVPISDPDQIVQARSLAQTFPVEDLQDATGINNQLMGARIEAGNDDGLNRDIGLSNRLWNWRVTEVISFGEIGIHGIFNDPLKVENNLDEVLTTGGTSPGIISFPTYTITGELPFQPSAILEDGRKESWFGTFRDDNFPWIGHETFGILYVSGMDPENIWFWSRDRQTWFFTRESHGNFIYRSSDGAWLFRSEGNQWFYNYKTQSWEFRAL